MMDNLREKYANFYYYGYAMSENETTIFLKYHFEIEGLKSFEPSYEFDKKLYPAFDFEDEVIQELVFSIGMVELVSYYKATLAKRVIIKCHQLNTQQKLWWKKLYYRGLGEFFYRNNLEMTFADFMDIECEENYHFPLPKQCIDEAVLIPIGGGKDSIVTLELLKKLPLKAYSFMINPRQTLIETHFCAFDAFDNMLGVKRVLDLGIVDLNKQGFYNGHTPFSAIVAFVSVLVAHVKGIRYIALSNEDSANEASVKNSDVNHQYSKSYEFEADFTFYLKTYISDKVQYFSLLRPLSEYQIGKYFATKAQYFSIFKSCNVGSSKDIWCNECSKCLYVYILLSAFIPSNTILEIFKENLLEKEHLFKIFNQLIGLEDEKPFECVGSYDEINFAIIDYLKTYQDRPYLYAYYITTPKYQEYINKLNPYQNYYNPAHNLEEIFNELVKKELEINA